MKSLVINLDRSPQRLEHMEKIFKNMDLSFERVAAIDGNNLSDEQIKNFNKKNIKEAKRELAPAEIGCFLSHCKCWEIIASGNEPYVAVFEDDIYFSSKAKYILKSYTWIPKDADVIKLETTNKRTRINKETLPVFSEIKISRLLENHSGTGGYIVSRNHVKKHIKSLKNYSITIDDLFFDPIYLFNNNWRIYQMNPAICIQQLVIDRASDNNITNDFLSSDINNYRQRMYKEHKKNKYKLSISKKLKREVIRPFRQFLNLLRKSYIRTLSNTKYTVIDFLE